MSRRAKTNKLITGIIVLVLLGAIGLVRSNTYTRAPPRAASASCVYTTSRYMVSCSTCVSVWCLQIIYLQFFSGGGGDGDGGGGGPDNDSGGGESPTS